ncbi:MAG: FHA domain-containing serine/threonine-protein kinase [Minicystis sp.]
MGFFDRFLPKSKREGRLAREAQERELSGDLGAAVSLYTEAGLPDDAARVLLLRADAEGSVEKRMAFCALAAATAAGEELKTKARARKALIAFDTLRSRGGAFLANEVLVVARELEDTGELERAAEAYALGGDGEGEVRALTAAGAIEKLEERLKAAESATRSQRELETSLRKIADLDRTAERRAALEVARAALADRDDARLADAARAIRARLLRGPVVELAIEGEIRRCALGDEVTIGRGDATIVIASRAVSRRHLRVARGAAGVFVEDLETRNGTMLAGARIGAALPVGEGVSLMLGGEVPCNVAPAERGMVVITLAGTSYLAPLGDLPVHGWRVAADGELVTLVTPAGAERPYLGNYQLAARVELAHGDQNPRVPRRARVHRGAGGARGIAARRRDRPRGRSPAMSFLSRVRSWIKGSAEAPAGEGPAESEEQSAPASERLPETSAAEESKKIPAPVRRLGKVGLPDGPSTEEAIALLRRVRGTVHESAAVTEALRGLGQRPIPEPVRVACADVLAARGDEQGALRVLEGVTSMPGLVLAADLYASTGQLARAVGTIERVLARDLDAPGARERHQRWSAALGYARGPVRRLDEATVVAPQATGAPFRLLREVARGGAGAVYEAEDELLGRKIAFKVYHGRGKDGDVLAREARTAARLAGPGVMRVLDADPGEGWIALEWIARGSIRDLLKTGDVAALLPLSRWTRPLARALARIHAEGLVHADVKPANVLLRQSNDPVLGDFGIARPIGARAEGGSAGYLSPERLAGRPSDPRDDVYGFGRILEDVIHRLDEAGADAGPEVEAYRALALACIGPDEGRPADGAELLRRLP